MLIAIVRKYYTAKFRKQKLITDKKSFLDIFLLIITGITMIIPLVYVFSDILDFADYHTPHILKAAIIIKNVH